MGCHLFRGGSETSRSGKGPRLPPVLSTKRGGHRHRLRLCLTLRVVVTHEPLVRSLSREIGHPVLRDDWTTVVVVSSFLPGSSSLFGWSYRNVYESFDLTVILTSVVLSDLDIRFRFIPFTNDVIF